MAIDMRSLSATFPLVEPLVRGLRSRLARASGIVLSANVLSGAMNFAAIIVTIRFLSPEHFGILTFAVTTMQLLGMLGNAGLNETLMTLVSRAEAAGRPAEVSQSFVAILRFRLVVSGVMVILGLFLARPIAAGIFGQPDLGLPLALGVVGACGVSWYQFSLTGLQALRAYGRHAAVALIRFAATLVALSVLAAMDKLDLEAALAVNVGAPFLAFAASLFLAPFPRPIKGTISWTFLQRIWDLSKWTVVISLCSMFFSRLEIYFLTAFASTTDLGIYGAALKLCGGMLILETAVRTVLFPEIARRAGSPDLARFTRRCAAWLVPFAGLVYGLGLLASPFIPGILGERYAPSVPIFLVVLAARAGVIPLVPLSLLFYATDRIRAGAVAGALQLAVLVGAGVVLIPRYGAWGAAWTSVLVTVSALLSMLVFAWPYLAGASAPLRFRVTDRV